MKASHKLAFLVITLFACAAPGCPHRKWNGPSTFYRALDGMEARNGKITRREWELMYGICMKRHEPACAWSFAEYTAEFTCMDRDGDNEVTWSEYYDFRFTYEDRVDCPMLYNLRRYRPQFG